MDQCTNQEKWEFYCKDLVSPNSFIRWGLYSAISAALQRRVWIGHTNGALYGNLYIVFVAEPGIGKGLVTRQVTRLLNHNVIKTLTDSTTGVTASKPMIHVGANAITYEALVGFIARSITAMSVPNPLPDNPDNKKIYIHCSICFNLEELGSLFRKHTEDTVRFFLEGYDCVDYKYETKNQGTDNIKNCCVSLLAGTQPSFIKKVFGEELLTEGFSSRSIFIYELSNRAIRFDPPEFNDAQLQAFQDIADHIRALSKLYGRVNFTPEAHEYLNLWWTTEAQHKPNNNKKLVPYYSRKNMAVQKLAMVMHFMEHSTMTIGIETCKKALQELDYVEKRMHLALQTQTENPLSTVTKNILSWLRVTGGKTMIEILDQFYDDLPEGKDSLKEAMEYLQSTQKVIMKDGKYQENKN